jgi:carboxymethylenebutenolidase
VIVVQEWWGLVPHIEHICDRLAAQGLNALAPDLYRGESATSPDAARKLMMSLNVEETEKTLRSAVAFLLDQPMVKGQQVGIMGFCMGGMLALYGASLNQAIRACVDFYGVPHPTIQPKLAGLHAPLLGFFGAEDHVVPLNTVRDLEARLKALGKDVEFVIYDGVGHAFFNDTRKEVYAPQAATDAWMRLLHFFRERL